MRLGGHIALRATLGHASDHPFWVGIGTGPWQNQYMAITPGLLETGFFGSVLSTFDRAARYTRHSPGRLEAMPHGAGCYRAASSPHRSRAPKGSTAPRRAASSFAFSVATPSRPREVSPCASASTRQMRRCYFRSSSSSRIRLRMARGLLPRATLPSSSRRRWSCSNFRRSRCSNASFSASMSRSSSYGLGR